MLSAATSSFMSKGIYAVPIFFFVGIAIHDYRRSQKVRQGILLPLRTYLISTPMQLQDEYVERRVLQQLGEWSPPALSDKERVALLAERETILEEIRDLEVKSKPRVAP